MRKASWLVAMGLLVLAVGLSPAKADLFGFTVTNPRTTFDGASLFEVLVGDGTHSSLYRNVSPANTAMFNIGAWGGGDFYMYMTISGLTANNATGTGGFTFRDVDGDLVEGGVTGLWTRAGGNGTFAGSLLNVTYTPNNLGETTFDGSTGSTGPVSMVFAGQEQPWDGGWLIQGTTTGTWFTLETSYDVAGGSIDAGVTPLPAAFLLGLLGLGTAGMRLRKFA